MTKSTILLCSINAMAKLGRNEDVRVGVLEKETYPKIVWEYNHIVGYEIDDINSKIDYLEIINEVDNK